jgi:glycosyltransferase involved in cell wall biosynthesis
MKKILIVVTKGDVGGAQMSVLNLALGLRSKKMNVVVGFGEGTFLQKKMEEVGMPIIHFGSLKRTANPLSNFLFIWEMKKFLDKNSFDVVHFNSSNALVGAIGAKISKHKPRTIFTFRGLSFLDPNHQGSAIVKFIYRIVFKILLKFVDIPVFVSKTNMEYAQKIRVVKNGSVIYNGLSSNFLSKEKSLGFLEKQIGHSLKNSRIIGSIGRLAYPKNYEFLIYSALDLMGKLQTTKYKILFLIIGDGPERTFYEKLIKKYGLEENFYFLGEMNDASQYMKAFDLFSLPSIYEGMSLTVIEAVSAGIPVLISRVGGNPEIVNGDENQLFELNNKPDFVEKTYSILNNKKLCNQISERNKNRAQRFSASRMVGQYFELINKI